MQHLMLDLETLDTRDTACILSVGAVAFDEKALGTRFYEEINVDDQLRHGRTVSGKTLAWWMAQNDVAKQVLSNQEKAKRLTTVLAKFTGLFKDGQETFVWGNGAAFDNAILRNAYEALGIKTPWPFRHDRCYRTLKAMFPNVPSAEPVVAHNALEDAVAQAKHAQELFKCLRK